MQNYELFKDINITLSVELGCKRLSIGELTSLNHGDIIELDTFLHSPLKVFANGKLIALAELVTIEKLGNTQQLGLRIVEILNQS